MIEINIKVKELDGEIQVAMNGLATGDEYTKEEADVADVIAEALKTMPFPGKDSILKKDFHQRIGR